MLRHGVVQRGALAVGTSLHGCDWTAEAEYLFVDR